MIEVNELERIWKGKSFCWNFHGGGGGESQVRCQLEWSSSPVTSASKSQLLMFVSACLNPLFSILLQSVEERDLQLSHTAVILSILRLQLYLYILSCVITGFRHKVDENCVILVYYGASSGNFWLTFRDNLSVPLSGFNNPKGFRSNLQGSTIQKDFGPIFRVQQSKITWILESWRWDR